MADNFSRHTNNTSICSSLTANTTTTHNNLQQHHRATVASELESLLGYSSFWALLSLGSLTGSLADAAFSRLPITQGPGPAVAAVAGALLAYHARNW